ncbi:hypothetical protein HDV00_008688 [Rhizophlyctis rosea]|nr:hypothetical protein HDV00_008688 [Rhizophlyctis rosea]
MDNLLLKRLEQPTSAMMDGQHQQKATLPLPNLLPPEILTSILTYLRPNIEYLTDKERRRAHIELCKDYRECAVACKTWTPVALQFVWRDLCADPLKDTIRPVTGRKDLSLDVIGPRLGNPRPIRRVSVNDKVEGSAVTLCSRLLACTESRILKLQGAFLGWMDLAFVFKKCLKLVYLSITVCAKGQWDGTGWKLEPWKDWLKSGFGRLRIFDIENGHGHLKFRTFTNFIYSSLTPRLQALVYTSRDGEFTIPIQKLLSQPTPLRQQNLRHNQSSTLVIRWEYDLPLAIGYRTDLDTLSLRHVNLTTQTLVDLMRPYNSGPSTVHFLPHAIPQLDMNTYANYITAKAPYWEHIHFDQMPVPPVIMDLISEHAKNLQTARFTRCGMGQDKEAVIEASKRLIRRCGLLSEFTNDAIPQGELDELMRESWLGPAEADCGRGYLEKLEDGIFWGDEE